MKLAV